MISRISNIRYRLDAYGFLHGYGVGGASHFLLEVLDTAQLNFLLGVAFNKEVGRDGAVYLIKDKGNLSNLINEVDNYKRRS